MMPFKRAAVVELRLNLGLTYWLPSSPLFWEESSQSLSEIAQCTVTKIQDLLQIHHTLFTMSSKLCVTLINPLIPSTSTETFFCQLFSKLFKQCVLGKAIKIGSSSRVWSLSGFVNVSLNHRCCWEKEMSGVDLLFAEPIKSWVRCDYGNVDQFQPVIKL